MIRRIHPSDDFFIFDFSQINLILEKVQNTEIFRKNVFHVIIFESFSAQNKISSRVLLNGFLRVLWCHEQLRVCLLFFWPSKYLVFFDIIIIILTCTTESRCSRTAPYCQNRVKGIELKRVHRKILTRAILFWRFTF